METLIQLLGREDPLEEETAASPVGASGTATSRKGTGTTADRKAGCSGFRSRF